MAQTPRLDLTKPAIGDTGWGAAVNENWDKLDTSAIPDGGTTGQILRKKSNTDYDTEWGTDTSGSDLAAIQDQIQYLMFRDDAGYTNLNGLVYDGFTDQTGIDDTASSGESYDAANDHYENSLTYTIIDHAAGTLIGNMTASGGLAAAFDENTNQNDSQGAKTVNIETGTVGKDYGAGSEKDVRAWKAWGTTDSGFNYPQTSGAAIIHLEWSSNGSSWTSIDNVSNADVPGTIDRAVGSAGAKRYWHVKIIGGAGRARCAEVQFFTGEPNNIVLVSENSTALSESATARISVFVNPVDALTLNTDIKAYASRDGGSTWDQITLAKVADLASSIDQLTGEVTLTSTGTTMKWKITTHNSKQVEITGVGLAWF